MLVVCIFSFSHSVFCSIKERNHHFNLLSANAFNWVTSKILLFGNGSKMSSLISWMFFERKFQEIILHRPVSIGFFATINSLTKYE